MGGFKKGKRDTHADVELAVNDLGKVNRFPAEADTGATVVPITVVVNVALSTYSQMRGRIDRGDLTKNSKPPVLMILPTAVDVKLAQQEILLLVEGEIFGAGIVNDGVEVIQGSLFTGFFLDQFSFLGNLAGVQSYFPCPATLTLGVEIGDAFEDLLVVIFHPGFFDDKVGLDVGLDLLLTRGFFRYGKVFVPKVAGGNEVGDFFSHLLGGGVARKSVLGTKNFTVFLDTDEAGIVACRNLIGAVMDRGPLNVGKLEGLGGAVFLIKAIHAEVPGGVVFVLAGEVDGDGDLLVSRDGFVWNEVKMVSLMLASGTPTVFFVKVSIGEGIAGSVRAT